MSSRRKFMPATIRFAWSSEERVSDVSAGLFTIRRKRIDMEPPRLQALSSASDSQLIIIIPAIG
jgi:hypothetical protein